MASCDRLECLSQARQALKRRHVLEAAPTAACRGGSQAGGAASGGNRGQASSRPADIWSDGPCEAACGCPCIYGCMFRSIMHVNANHDRQDKTCFCSPLTDQKIRAKRPPRSSASRMVAEP